MKKIIIGILLLTTTIGGAVYLASDNDIETEKESKKKRTAYTRNTNIVAPAFAADGQGFKAKNTVFEISLPQDSQGKVVITKGKTLAFTPTNAQSARAKTSGNKIIYADAYPSSDIEYVTTTKGIKESIVLRSNSNLPEKFTYRFDAKDLKGTLGSDNSITFTQVSKEQPRDIPVSDGTLMPAKKASNFLPEYPQRFKTAPPIMIDADGKKSEASDVKVTLTENTLSLQPNKDWLQKAKFPVVLDPTVETTPQIVEEMADKRTSTSKDFLNDDGTYTSVIFENPLHYNNGAGLKDIDRTFRLTVDPTYEYQVTTGIYTAKVKKTLTGNGSDIQLAFANTNIGFSPTKIGWSNGDAIGTIKNVTGTISDDKSTVTYNSMFGIAGIDLEAIYDNEKFLKETVINNQQAIQAPTHTNDNLEITFTLDLPKDVNLKVDGKVWDKNSTVETMDKITVVKNGQEISDLRKAIVYSENPKDPSRPGEDSQTIKVKLAKDGNHLTLTKIISGTWLAKATYPIRTDTTDTIYGVAGDGYVYSTGYVGEGATYANVRAGSGTGVSLSYGMTILETGQNLWYDEEWNGWEGSNKYDVIESYVAFDTSPVNTDTVDAATLSLYLVSDYSTTDFTNQARLKTWTPGGLTSADWVAGTDISAQTLLATKDTNGIGASGYKDFTSEAAFASNINRSGNTEIIIGSDRHSGNNTPTGGEWMNWYNSYTAGTTYDPKLVVIYTRAESQSHAIASGITETEAQFGGIQRKVVYANNNWYAFYNDGTDVWYKKSSHGTAWGNAVDVDGTDADNINPSIYLSGDLIYVAWLDTGSNVLEVNTINTASADALGTKCSSPSPGTLSSTYMTSVAVAQDGTVYLVTTDTSTGPTTALYKLTFSGCSFSNIGQVSGTEILRPDGQISSSFMNAGAATTWEAVDESVADDSTSYAYQHDYYNDVGYLAYLSLQATSLTTETITSIDVTLRGSASDDTQGYSAGVKRSSWETWGGGRYDYTWTTYTNSALARPNGGTWVVGDLADLQLSLNMHTGYTDDSAVSITQAYVTVNYISGIGGNPIGSRPVLVTMGNNLHVIFQDGNLSHSVFDGSSWATDNATIASVADSTYSVTTDGTNLWVLSLSGTTGTNLYKFNGSTWSTLTSPWTGQTNLTSVSLSYESDNTTLHAYAIKDSSEQAYYKTTDANSISWGTDTSLGFTPGDLGHISSPLSGAGIIAMGAILRQGQYYEHANAPARRANFNLKRSVNLRGGINFR